MGATTRVKNWLTPSLSLHPPGARTPSPWPMTSAILPAAFSCAVKWSSLLHRLVACPMARRSRTRYPHCLHCKSSTSLAFLFPCTKRMSPHFCLSISPLSPKVGVANWTDLQAAKAAFNRSQGLHYGGPLGDDLNATIAEQFTPAVRLSDQNVTTAYLEVCRHGSTDLTSHLVTPRAHICTHSTVTVSSCSSIMLKHYPCECICSTLTHRTILFS